MAIHDPLPATGIPSGTGDLVILTKETDIVSSAISGIPLSVPMCTLRKTVNAGNTEVC